MFDSIHRPIMAGYAVSIEFTKQGWRQFARLNASLGTRYIRAFILKRDVAEYIAAHEVAGVKLDTECQELRYDGGAPSPHKPQKKRHNTQVIRYDE